MYSLKFIKHRPILRSDLKKILKWRNNSKIRNKMLNNKIIRFAEHKKWFENLKKNKQSEAFIFLYNKEDVGYGIINEIDRHNKTCTWGMYLDPKYINSGLGVLIEIYTIERIFSHHKIRKVWGDALSSDHDILNIHKMFGFSVEGVFKKQIIKNNIYQDVVRVSIFDKDWKRNIKRILKQMKIK